MYRGLKGIVQYHEIFCLHFFKSNWSSRDPDSRVKIILQKNFISWSHLSFTFFCRCGIQRKRFFSVVGYNRIVFFPLGETTEKVFLRCGIQQMRIFSVVGYNGEQSQDGKQILFYCIPQCRKFFFCCILHLNRILCSVLYLRKIFSIVSHNASGFLPVVSHNGRYFPPLWDTKEEVFFRCGIQRKKLSSIVGYNGRGFFHCGIQRKRFFSVVGYNGEKNIQCRVIFLNLSASHCLQIKILEKLATWTVKQ